MRTRPSEGQYRRALRKYTEAIANHQNVGAQRWARPRRCKYWLKVARKWDAIVQAYDRDGGPCEDCGKYGDRYTYPFGGQDTFLCDRCVTAAGFCWRCGAFVSGIDTLFDMGVRSICGECWRDEYAENAADESELDLALDNHDDGP